MVRSGFDNHYHDCDEYWIFLEGGNPARAVWFEGALEGKKRPGHLWEPQHGRAAPQTDRV